MTRFSAALAALTLAAALSACTTAPPPKAQPDPHEGTSFSPYRSIAPVIQCDDCRY